jgi:dTDP-4-dehydrorhamnose 3,5-epimerase
MVSYTNIEYIVNMKLVDSGIDGISGLQIYERDKKEDDRGFFARVHCNQIFQEFGGSTAVEQSNISFNPIMGTLRGFHFQKQPYAETKTILVLNGKLHYKIILQVPSGCTLAFQSLAENTLLHYNVSSRYEPNYESGIRFDDPYFNFSWPMEVLNISKRDLSFPNFNPEIFDK